MSKEIRDRIVKLRKKMGYNQADVAHLLNMNRNTYAYQEANCSFSVDTFVKLAEILEVTPNDLLLPEKIDTPLFAPLDIPVMKVADIVNDPFNRLELNLSTNESNLVKSFRMLRKKQRDEALEFINKLLHEK